jgi:hypothetical protein
MNNNKITYLLGAIVVIVLLYFAYNKFIKKDEVRAEVDPVVDKDTAIANREEVVEDILTEREKAENYDLAVKIYRDMKGWNRHDMDLYAALFVFDDDRFFHFIVVAYPTVDSWSFSKRLAAQNFKKIKDGLSPWLLLVPGAGTAAYFISKAIDKKWTPALAVELIAKIKKRMDTFKI